MAEVAVLEDGPADADWTLLLAHGAGQGMDAPFMAQIARCLSKGGVRVLRFNFPYMMQSAQTGRRRPPDRAPVLQAAFIAAIEQVLAEGAPKDRLLIGGKSMGGRMASLLADEQGVAGLVCLGYPFHPSAKPEKLRTEHLGKLHTPTLICQGERDTFGSRAEVEAYRLSDTIRLCWLPDGDHSFKPRKTSGHSEAGNLSQACAAVLDFIRGLG